MLRRRQFFVGALAAGYAAGFARPPESRAAALPRERVRLGFVGYPCEAATFAAPTSALFRRAALDARLVRFPDEAALIAALDAGKIDAGSMNLPALLKPLESGAHIRVVAGLHAGCLRVLARDVVALTAFGDLKGQTIATDRLNGPSMSLLAAILRRSGIDPQHDVNWHVATTAEIESGLDSKAIACVAASDPVGYALLTDHKAEPYLDSAGGGFSCGGDIAPGHHCFLALHSGFIDSRPAAAAALTRAYLATTAAIGRGVGPFGVAAVRGGYVPSNMYATLGMLASYDWSAATDLTLQEIELTARDFRRAGLLRAATDPQTLADRAFADVLHA